MESLFSHSLNYLKAIHLWSVINLFVEGVAAPTQYQPLPYPNVQVVSEAQTHPQKADVVEEQLISFD